MKTFTLTVLGSSAAMPSYGRFTSCHSINYNDKYFLVDCGEGAQIRVAQYKVKRNKIACIFISHLHGDHIFGLPGLLTSFNHFDRKIPLKLFGPKGLRSFVETIFSVGNSSPNYDLEIIEFETDGLLEVWKNHELVVSAFPLKHRIETYGYRFDEVIATYNILPEAIKKFELNYEEIRMIKTGKDVVRPDETISYKDCTIPKSSERSYAYCSDTIYDEDLVQYISGVDVLYHETTYTNEFVKEAEERYHTTGAQAGRIAQLANVNTLITGHYSARYRVGQEPFEEALSVFPNTKKGYDGFMFRF